MTPIVKRLSRQFDLPRSSILTFSCSRPEKSNVIHRSPKSRERISQTTNLHTVTDRNATTPRRHLLHLPTTCPGCGAYAQDRLAGEPGYFSSSRKALEQFAIQDGQGTGKARSLEAKVFSNVMKNVDQSLLDQLDAHNEGVSFESPSNGHTSTTFVQLPERPAPVCDRCHHLRHHNKGCPITHPTLRYVRKVISESPYKYNHIYHVIDAADFPLSLVPSLQQYLSLSAPRSLNRRSRRTHFQRGGVSAISYIISRADLLAPKKEQVDKLMPYIVDVLRNALGGSAQHVRLGNVHCVSSKRGWWTRALKEDIYNRGGGGWMVGKVNVGKSNLFENVFPKGFSKDVGIDSVGNELQNRGLDIDDVKEDITESFEELLGSSITSDTFLPPIPKETPFPTMPLVSSLPGTTASPIRLSYGGRRGELIDLPGLNRGGLESFVVEGHKTDLVMQQRIKAKQFTIKPGQSMIVGGLVKITAVTPDTTILAYPFVPLKCHVSSAEKARSTVTGGAVPGLSSIARPGLDTRMRTAGVFPLKWDVTKARAGPLTAKAAVGLDAGALPFIVLSADVLIEGCGWIELVAQVRKRNFLDSSESTPTKSLLDDKQYPMVEIVSPDGRHVGYRRPLGAWLLGGEPPSSSNGRSQRPRRSMKGVKKNMKRMKVRQ